MNALVILHEGNEINNSMDQSKIAYLVREYSHADSEADMKIVSINENDIANILACQIATLSSQDIKSVSTLPSFSTEDAKQSVYRAACTNLNTEYENIDDDAKLALQVFNDFHTSHAKIHADIMIVMNSPYGYDLLTKYMGLSERIAKVLKLIKLRTQTS